MTQMSRSKSSANHGRGGVGYFWDCKLVEVGLVWFVFGIAIKSSWSLDHMHFMHLFYIMTSILEKYIRFALKQLMHSTNQAPIHDKKKHIELSFNFLVATFVYMSLFMSSFWLCISISQVKLLGFWFKTNNEYSLHGSAHLHLPYP